ncbi:hypothetical protein HPP92_010884 [Vanilla planifolia]|uniref:Uncharacterized protein n=1 Tax=Vanilla planifolia TaxID=51239 RepID=A0A835V1V1_VANPL|nr:hypothetical protein HPP92_010884 [Vanilla planifolia]
MAGWVTVVDFVKNGSEGEQIYCIVNSALKEQVKKRKALSPKAYQIENGGSGPRSRSCSRIFSCGHQSRVAHRIASVSEAMEAVVLDHHRPMHHIFPSADDPACLAGRRTSSSARRRS